jgi:predicted dienelactone hydrolase
VTEIRIPRGDAPCDIVVCSHGTGSSPAAFGGLADALVDAGFAVALVTHAGNTRGDDALAGTVEILERRPRDVSRALDEAIAALGARAGRAAVVGHSLGGYTALACVGGKPVALPNQTPDGKAHPITVQADARVGAAVLLAPAIPWFLAPGALAEVHVPLLVRTGQRDDVAPAVFAERVLAGVAMDYEAVPEAGHFAWFWPLTDAQRRMPPGQDPPGFDRAAYQPRFHAEVIAFLGSSLHA